MKYQLLSACLALCLSFAGCTDGEPSDESLTGGTSSTGTMVDSGGNAGSGGFNNTGGSLDNSGASGSGGSGSGVVVGTGGGTATGGTSGASSGLGGVVDSGDIGDGSIAGQGGTGGNTSDSGVITDAAVPDGSVGQGDEKPLYECGLAPGPGSGVAASTGAGTNITVLPWAGFKAATSFSFDDNNSSQINNYSTLNALGVKFTFYIVTGWSSANDPVWNRALQDGHEIGNHTQNHSCGTSSAGQNDIKSKFGVTSYTLAAPNGDTSCGPQAQNLNLLLNRGVNGGSVSFTANESVAWNLPTSIPPAGARASSLNATIDGAYNKGEWQTFCIHGFTGDASAYQPFELSSFTEAVEKAKEKKDLWIDTMRAVGAYWRAGLVFAKAAKSTTGSDTTWKWTVPQNFPPNSCLRVTTDGGVVKQKDLVIPWDSHGYYEILFDAGEVTLSAQ